MASFLTAECPDFTGGVAGRFRMSSSGGSPRLEVVVAVFDPENSHALWKLHGAERFAPSENVSRTLNDEGAMPERLYDRAPA